MIGKQGAFNRLEAKAIYESIVKQPLPKFLPLIIIQRGRMALVESCSDKGYYYVCHKNDSLRWCSCPAYVYGGELDCKHLKTWLEAEKRLFGKPIETHHVKTMAELMA
jgi:hypothetical protein